MTPPAPAPPQPRRTFADRIELHRSAKLRFEAEARRSDAIADRISWLRLASFGAAAVLGYTAYSEASAPLLWMTLCCITLLTAAVAWHARVLTRAERSRARASVHERHLARVEGGWRSFPSDGAHLLNPQHAYAGDLDLFGPSSLFQRIDTTHTSEGEHTLAALLTGAHDFAAIDARQVAVAELADAHDLRRELEAAALAHGSAKLDPAKFGAFLALPALFRKKPWLLPATVLLNFAMLAAFVGSSLGSLDGRYVLACALANAVLLWTLRKPVHRALDLVTARLGFATALGDLLAQIERSPLQSPHLQALRERLRVGGELPSQHLRRLARYEGFAQLRTQGPVYLVVNVLSLWDLWCLERLERFRARVAPEFGSWVEVVAEVEALCSLATLADTDQDATFPRIDVSAQALEATGLGHPLLDSSVRVKNDLSLRANGFVLVVTGSNMAGKSTLLRALGQNVALALAGGPVTASALVLPPVRLRASMRIEDSLARGASYFHAELEKLRSVIAELDRGPRVLFLLDELLRGTNARAREQGSRAVLAHLLGHGAFGIVATHDLGLAELEASRPNDVANVHFTDVIEGDEMRFDYRLRPGVVQTSNALWLLARAGIRVEGASEGLRSSGTNGA